MNMNHNKYNSISTS